MRFKQKRYRREVTGVAGAIVQQRYLPPVSQWWYLARVNRRVPGIVQNRDDGGSECVLRRYLTVEKYVTRDVRREKKNGYRDGGCTESLRWSKRFIVHAATDVIQ